MRHREPRATIDGETRSAAELGDVGAWKYSKDPTTQLMVLRYRLPHWEPGRLGMWHMAHPDFLIGESPPPDDLFEWIDRGGRVEAHNVFFERSWWENLAVARMGWPGVRRHQWMCSAAKCSVHSLPRSLELACQAMRLPIQKDVEKAKSMKRLAKPVKLKKARVRELERLGIDPSTHVEFFESEYDIVTNWEYCGVDVLAEEGLSERLPDLSDDELELWMLNEDVNLRGVRVDLELCRAAVALGAEEAERLRRIMMDVTGGQVERPTQRERVKRWLLENEGIRLPDTTKDTVDKLLLKKEIKDDPERWRVRAILECMRNAGQTAATKYAKAIELADTDGRVRDIMMYHGAERTGRFAGKGLQVHNFKRAVVRDQEQLVRDIKEGNLEWLRLMHGDPISALGDCARGIVLPDHGEELYVADYAAIEARVVFWLARLQEALDIFRNRQDIYCEMASEIYGVPVTKKDEVMRFTGKQAILGLGFGMGAPKFRSHCLKLANVDLPIKMCRKVVKIYRKRFERVVQLWRDMEETAVEVVAAWQKDGEFIERPVGTTEGLIRFCMPEEHGGDFLQMVLPSGRRLHYREPQLKPQAMYQFTAIDPNAEDEESREVKITVSVPLGDDNLNDRYRWFLAHRACDGQGYVLKKPQQHSKRRIVGKLTYAGMDESGNNQWVRIDTYGGKLTENAVQATARDFLCHAILRGIKPSNVYKFMMSIHDEMVTGAKKGTGDVKLFERLMTTLPEWGGDCPVSCEAWGEGVRYKKG